MVAPDHPQVQALSQAGGGRRAPAAWLKRNVGSKAGSPLEGQTCALRDKLPQEGAPAVQDSLEHSGEAQAQGWSPAPPDTQHLLLRLSTRPHILEGARSLSSAPEGIADSASDPIIQEQGES